MYVYMHVFRPPSGAVKLDQHQYRGTDTFDLILILTHFIMTWHYSGNFIIIIIMEHETFFKIELFREYLLVMYVSLEVVFASMHRLTVRTSRSKPCIIKNVSYSMWCESLKLMVWYFGRPEIYLFSILVFLDCQQCSWSCSDGVGVEVPELLTRLPHHPVGMNTEYRRTTSRLFTFISKLVRTAQLLNLKHCQNLLRNMPSNLPAILEHAKKLIYDGTHSILRAT